VEELLDEAEQKIFQIAQTHDRKGFVWIKELLWPAMEQIELLSQNSSPITGVPTGFADLDEKTAGFQKGDLIIVAARPSMGKTAFTLNIAQHAAIGAHKAVAFFSLEMSKESLVQRMLTSEARVDASRVRTGRLRDDDYPRLAQAAGLLNTAPIYVDDTPGISILEMRAKGAASRPTGPTSPCRRRLPPADAGDAQDENRQQEVSEVSRGLKALAKELDVPVVALSQLSRAVESRPDKRPMMSDLRESGALEQDADVIMFLYRPEYYHGPTDKDGNNLEGRAELIIGKAAQRSDRNGSAHVPQGVHPLRELLRSRGRDRLPEVAMILRTQPPGGQLTRWPDAQGLFVCTDCGNDTPRWQGQCPACRGWNTLVEERAASRRLRGPPDRTSSPPRRRYRPPRRRSRLRKSAAGPRDRRIRFRARGRHRSGFGRADRGRAGDREVHAPAPGRGTTR
jgi:hypothetical protein